MGTRRSHGEGTITQRKDGRFEARLTLPNGKRKCLYAKTKPAVKAKLKQAQADVSAGVDLSAKPQTLANFLNHWLETVIKPNRAPKTYQNYELVCRVHIVPALGRTQLTKLTPQHIEHLLAGLRPIPSQAAPILSHAAPESDRRNGGVRVRNSVVVSPRLSPGSVRYVRSVLRAALNRAVRWQLITRNPVDLTEPVSVRREEVRPLSPEQARRLLDASRGDRLEALYSVALALGLRLGEALALTWTDVDLETGALHVRATLQRVGGTLIRKAPKTAQSRRTLTMPHTLRTALRHHRTRQLEERLAAGESWIEQDFIFTTTKGTPLDQSTVHKCFKALLRRADLPDSRFHDLRHCAASLLIAEGVPARVVMDVLGHSQISMTMNLYSHIFPAAKQEAADAIDRILSAHG